MARPRRPELNPRLAEYRQRAGLTQEEVAERIGISADMVRKHERGINQPIKIYREQYCLLHQTSEQELGIIATSPAQPTEKIEKVKKPPVLRRDFVKLGGVGIAVAALAGVAHESLLPRHGSRIGESAIETLRGNIIRLRRLDDYLGGSDTYQLYLAELKKIDDLLKKGTVSDPVKSELLSLFAEQAQQTGWAAFDAGQSESAQRLFQRSFDAAKEVNRQDLAANALALQSYQLLDSGQVSTELTEQSIAIAAGSVHPTVKSLLYQRGAWTYAATGQAKEAAQALGHASDALENGCVVDQGLDWATWAHNETELNIMAGRCWAELHRPLRAVPALETAMANYDDSHARDKALYLSWLADAYIDAREIEQAISVMSCALNLSADVASRRPRQRFNSVLAKLEPYRTTPTVSDLFARSAIDPV